MVRFALAVLATIWASALAQAAYLQAATYKTSDPAGPYTLTNPFTIVNTGSLVTYTNTVGGTAQLPAYGQYRDSAGGFCNISATANSGNPWTFQFSPSATQQWLVGRTQAAGCDSSGTVNPFSVQASASQPPNAIAKLYNPALLSKTQCIAVSDGSTTVFSAYGGSTAPSGSPVNSNPCSQGPYYPFLMARPVPGTMQICATFSGTQQCWNDYTGGVPTPKVMPTPVRLTSVSETSGSPNITVSSTTGILPGMAFGSDISTEGGLFVVSTSGGTTVTLSGNAAVTSSNRIRGFNWGSTNIVGSGNFAGGSVLILVTQDYSDTTPLTHRGAYYFQFNTAPDANTQITFSYQYGWTPDSNAGNLSTGVAPYADPTRLYPTYYLLPSVDDAVAAANAMGILPAAGSKPGSGIPYLDPAVKYGVPSGQVLANPCQDMTVDCRSSVATNRNTSADGGAGPYFNSGVTCTPGTAGSAGWNGGSWTWTAATRLFVASSTATCGLSLYGTDALSHNASGKFYSNTSNSSIVNSKVDYVLTGSANSGVTLAGTNNFGSYNEVFNGITLAIFNGLLSTGQTLSCVYLGGSSGSSPVTGISWTHSLMYNCGADGADFNNAGDGVSDVPTYTQNVILGSGVNDTTHGDAFQTTGANAVIRNPLISNNFHQVLSFVSSAASFPALSDFPQSIYSINSYAYMNTVVSGTSPAPLCGSVISNPNISNNYFDGGNGFVVAAEGSGCGTANSTPILGYLSGSTMTTSVATTLASGTTIGCNGCPEGLTTTGGTSTTTFTLSTTLGSPIYSSGSPGPIVTGLGLMSNIGFSNNLLGHNVATPPKTITNNMRPATETGNLSTDTGAGFGSGAPF